MLARDEKRLLARDEKEYVPSIVFGEEGGGEGSVLSDATHLLRGVRENGAITPLTRTGSNLAVCCFVASAPQPSVRY